jgi:hypothetical protein
VILNSYRIGHRFDSFPHSLYFWLNLLQRSSEHFARFLKAPRPSNSRIRPLFSSIFSESFLNLHQPFSTLLDICQPSNSRDPRDSSGWFFQKRIMIGQVGHLNRLPQ